MRKLLILICISIGYFSHAQNPNSWVKKADFGGFKREQAVAFTLLDKGYISTGVDTAENVLNDLWQYDPQLDTWTQRANLPGIGRRNAVAFTANNKAYIATGISANESTQGTKLKDNWEYTPSTNTWIQKADYPGAGGLGIYYGTGFGVNGKGYVCGGKIGPSNYSNELWEYKPATDEWVLRSNFPGGIRYNMSSLTIGNKAYLGLGTDQDNYRYDWWEYNPGSNQWTALTHFPGGQRASASAFTIGTKGYICLGTNGGLKDDLYEYNPDIDAWYPRANYGGSERKNAVAFSIGNSAYVGTGKGTSNKKGSMYEYIPASVLSVNEYQIQVSVFPNPSSSSITIQSSEPIEFIQLISSEGKIVYTEKIATTTAEIDVQSLPSGNYSVLLTSINGVQSSSIQIQH